MSTDGRVFHKDRLAQMGSDEEIGAYSMGVSDAYGDVFAAFSKAFTDSRDIYWLREQISAQWTSVAPVARGVL